MVKLTLLNINKSNPQHPEKFKLNWNIFPPSSHGGQFKSNQNLLVFDINRVVRRYVIYMKWFYV